jgi:adenylylsulfate kinase
MEYIFPVETKVNHHQRKLLMGQEPRLIWLTGLSGSGKTTIGIRLENCLYEKGYKVFFLDGDNIRKGLNKNLGFSEEDRKENIRRIAEVARLMLDAGLIVICAFISPYKEDRSAVKEIAGEDRYTEVYVKCPLNVCEERDVKGLYEKARQGLIHQFTGISAPYEEPLDADIEVRTDRETLDASVYRIIHHIEPLIQPQL